MKMINTNMTKALLLLLAIALSLTLGGCDKKEADAKRTAKINGMDAKSDIALQEINTKYKGIYTNPIYSKDAAGTTKLLQRSYENAPPLIPHSIEGLVPVTASNNMCISCHSALMASSVGATPVPVSHMLDLRTGKKMADGAIAGARYNCTQCHVPQSDAKPLVANTFVPYYRNKELMSASELAKYINEGYVVHDARGYAPKSGSIAAEFEKNADKTKSVEKNADKTTKGADSKGIESKLDSTPKGAADAKGVEKNADKTKSIEKKVDKTTKPEASK